MAFWSSYFHRSDADDSLARTLRGIRENVVAMQVVLGNETTENSLVHDVKVLKSDVEMDKEQDRQLVSRMDSVKTASDQLKEEVETVRKMKGPKGERGDRGPKGERGSAGPRGLRGEQGPSDPFHLLPYIAQNAYYYSSRVNEGSASLDVYETASHGVKKTKKRLLFFSSECLEKL